MTTRTRNVRCICVGRHRGAPWRASMTTHISQFAETPFWSFRAIALQIQTAPGLEPNVNSPAYSLLVCLLVRRANVNVRANETLLDSEWYRIGRDLASLRVFTAQ